MISVFLNTFFAVADSESQGFSRKSASVILVSSSWNKKDGVKELTKSGVDRVVDMTPNLRVFSERAKAQK